MPSGADLQPTPDFRPPVDAAFIRDMAKLVVLLDLDRVFGGEVSTLAGTN